MRPGGRVYLAEDEWTGILADPELADRFRRVEERLLAGCDVALGVSPALIDRFAELAPATHLAENAADVAHFGRAAGGAVAPHPMLAALPPGPRVGFVGQFDTRMDQALMAGLAAARPAWQFCFVGRVREDLVPIDPRLKGAPNVHFLGFADYGRFAGGDGRPRRGRGAVPGQRPRGGVQPAQGVRVPRRRAAGRLDGFAGPWGGAGGVAGGGVARGVLGLPRPARWPTRGRAATGGCGLARANSWDARADALAAHLAEAVARRSRLRPEPHTAGRPARWIAGGAGAAAALPERPQGAVRRRDRPVPPARRGRAGGVRGGPAAGQARRRRPRPPPRGGRGVRSILVVRTGCFLGDLIAAVPMLAELRRRHPRARITLAVSRPELSAGLLGGSPYVDEVVKMDLEADRGRRPGRPAQAPPTRRGRAVVSAAVRPDGLRHTFSYFTPTAVLAGPRRSVGLYDGTPGQTLLDRLVPNDPARHEADNNRRLALDAESPQPRRDRRGVRPTRPSPTTWSSTPARLADAAEAVRAMLDLPAGARLLLVHPGSKRPSRRWPLASLAAAVDALCREYSELHVALTGVGEESRLAAELAAMLCSAARRRVRDLTDRTTLMQLSALIDHSDLVLSPDTGVMHLARARGRPLAALLGAGQPRPLGADPAGPGSGRPRCAARCRARRATAGTATSTGA